MKFRLEDPLLHVSISRSFGDLVYRKPPFLRRDQEDLCAKWARIRGLPSEFRHLGSLLQDNSYLIRYGLMDEDEDEDALPPPPPPEMLVTVPLQSMPHPHSPSPTP
ncbi:hypothetical protein Fot_11578 [Forsythia ovata]|uniref:Uncharacterized protein n=1 Tax=Forsythia ovata TaxID=205694 RepID=A0ABD1WK40_9LAMI